MDQVRLPNHESDQGTASLITRIRRFATKIGMFTDIQGYRDEIVKYEGELRLAARGSNRADADEGAERREPAIS